MWTLSSGRWNATRRRGSSLFLLFSHTSDESFVKRTRSGVWLFCVVFFADPGCVRCANRALLPMLISSSRPPPAVLFQSSGAERHLALRENHSLPAHLGRVLPMTADATPRRKAAMFASLTSDLRWRRPVPLGTRRLDYSLNNSRKLRPLNQPPLELQFPACQTDKRVAASGKELRVPSSSSPRPGWRWLAHSVGVQIPSLPPNSRPPDSRNFIPPFLPNGHCPRALGNHFR